MKNKHNNSQNNNNSINPPSFEFLKLSLKKLKEEGINKLELLNLINSELDNLYKDDRILLPISLFQNRKLSSLESIVKYLKENLHLNYKEIAKLLNRNEIPIGNCYRLTKNKHPYPLTITHSKINIPLEIFLNQKLSSLSILETIIYHLRKNHSNTTIAYLMNRSDRTISTVYARAKKKIQILTNE